MSFSEEGYATVRPFLYHLTDRRNIERVRRTGSLQSAATLLQQAGQLQVVRARRIAALQITVEGDPVILCDQAPLHEGNIQFNGGWSLPEFVEHLNHHVFFWSGWNSGPVPYGVRHFNRYSLERPMVIRATFQSVRTKNPGAQLRFCRYNSGSPRWSNGRPSPRGPGTFSTALSSCFWPREVVEVGQPSPSPLSYRDGRTLMGGLTSVRSRHRHRRTARMAPSSGVTQIVAATTPGLCSHQTSFP